MKPSPVELRALSLLIAPCLVAVLLSCGDEEGMGPATGALRVTTLSGGIGADPDGYVLRLDDATAGPIRDRPAVVLTGLAAGDHTVALDNVVSFCAVDGGPSRTVTIPAGDTVDVAFAVTCEAVGGLDISVRTDGGTPDRDGYSVSVDGGFGQAIEPDGALSVGPLAAGSHTLTVAGLSFNCQVDGANPTTVDVVPEAVTAVRLTVTCSTLAPWRGVFLKLGDVLWVNPDASTDIVYTSDVFSVEPAAGAVTRVTRSPILDITPELSPDHTKVVFEREGGDTYWRMAVVGVDGTGLHELQNGANLVADHRPTWSPDGSRIAYHLWPNHLQVMNADGSGEVEVFAFGNPPLSWSPDGTALATTGGPDQHHRQVYIVRADGTGSVRLTSGPESAMEAFWSPDGRRLAFTLRTFNPTGGDYYDDVWVMNTNGSQRYALTRSPPVGAFPGSRHPRWSPDGKRILFQTATRTSKYDLFVIQADGAGLVNLTNTPDRNETDGEWSSDGTKIIFTRDGANDCGVVVSDAFIMNPDGSNVANVSHNLCP